MSDISKETIIAGIKAITDDLLLRSGSEVANVYFTGTRTELALKTGDKCRNRTFAREWNRQSSVCSSDDAHGWFGQTSAHM